MKFSVSEFLAFARKVQLQEWHTLSQKKPYKYKIENSGLRITPSTGDERVVSNAELARFCEIYNDTNSLKTLNYKKLFNKSYLLPLAKAFDPKLVEFSLPEEVMDASELREGTVRQISVNAYERSSEARRLCIEAHGSDCVICGFSFAKVYGDFAAGFIHVHHLTPIALKGYEYTVDPVKDLRPVCPNCHAVIHLRGDCLSIEELKNMLHSHGQVK